MCAGIRCVGEVSLRDLIRSGEPDTVDPVLREVVAATVQKKKKMLGGHGSMCALLLHWMH